MNTFFDREFFKMCAASTVGFLLGALFLYFFITFPQAAFFIVLMNVAIFYFHRTYFKQVINEQ